MNLFRDLVERTGAVRGRLLESGVELAHVGRELALRRIRLRARRPSSGSFRNRASRSSSVCHELNQRSYDTTIRGRPRVPAIAAAL